jgi:hypothetical protein
VHFQGEKTQESVAVQSQAQLFHVVQQHTFGREKRLAQPAGVIASDLVTPQTLSAADARPGKLTARLADPCAFDQLANSF